MVGRSNLRDNILHNGRGNSAGTRVQDIGEMVLGEHRVRRVVAAGVRPRLELLVRARVDEACRAILQLLGDGRDDGLDKRCEEAENKDCQCLTDVVKQTLEAGDLGDHVADCTHDLVAELENRVDLLCYLDGVEIGAHSGNHVDVAFSSGVLSLLRLGSLLEVPRLRCKTTADARELRDQRDEVSIATTGGAKFESKQATGPGSSPAQTGRFGKSFGVLEGNVHLVNLRLGKVISGFSQNRVQEIDSPESAGDKGVDSLSSEVDLRVSAAVSKHIAEPELGQGKFAVVAVSTEVLHGVERLAQASQCLAEIGLFSRCAAGAVRVDPAVVNAASKAVPEISGTGRPATALVADVVLHAGLRVDFEFPRVNRATQPGVVLAGVLAVSIAKGVVNVLFGPVDAKSLFGDFEFLSSISVGHERKYPDLRAVSELAWRRRPPRSGS